MKKNLFLLTALVVGLSLTASAQGQTFPLDSAFWQNMPDRMELNGWCDCPPGYSQTWITKKWGRLDGICTPSSRQVTVCEKSGQPSFLQSKGGGVVPTTTENVFVDESHNEINNFYFLGDTATTEKDTILSVIQTNLFVALDGTLPTDREFKAFTPIARAGWEVSAHLEEAPALQVKFQVNAVTIPAAFVIANCGGCIPQNGKGIFGVQARAELQWRLAPKTTLVAYGRTATWMPLRREVKALPDAGWGAELVFGKPTNLVNLHIGGVTSKAGFTGYAGVKISLFQKSRTGEILKPAKLKRA